MASPTYRGRFAPSPTGPLHLGSLIAALASYLDARHQGGQWLVRMDDLDPPREEPGAADRILASLRHHGLHWDGTVLYQSKREAAYDAARDQLDALGLLFRCDCSRALLAGGPCGGRCRPRQPEVAKPWALRVAVPRECRIRFRDRLLGPCQEALGETTADFVVRRRDGLNAYQLAVTVDDAFQDITHVVRGSDLLDSTARQIYLQQVLGYPTPDYAHIPVVTNAAGQKLSKQNHAPALDDTQAAHNLRQALRFLQQQAPPDAVSAVDDILSHAVSCWSLGRLPPVHTVTAASAGLDRSFTG